MDDTADGLDVVIRDDEDGRTISCLGELHSGTRSVLDDALRGALAARPDRLHIDCGRLSFVSPGGIETLLDAAVRAGAEGVALTMTFNRQMQRLFERVGLWWLGGPVSGAVAEAAMLRVLGHVLAAV